MLYGRFPWLGTSQAHNHRFVSDCDTLIIYTLSGLHSLNTSKQAKCCTSSLSELSEAIAQGLWTLQRRFSSPISEHTSTKANTGKPGAANQQWQVEGPGKYGTLGELVYWMGTMKWVIYDKFSIFPVSLPYSCCQTLGLKLLLLVSSCGAELRYGIVVAVRGRGSEL